MIVTDRGSEFTDLLGIEFNGDGERRTSGCVAFGKNAEFAEKYLRQGTKIALVGRIQTGSYTNRDGQKVFTTDIVVEEQEFAESKAAASGNTNHNAYGRSAMPQENAGGFVVIPDSIGDELPFV